jgi:ribosomal protein S18 acetylase RimI-like enzyme
MTIERVTVVDAKLVAAFARLIPQLSKAPPPDAAALAAIAAGSVLLVARDGDGEQIVGTLTLTLYRIPTGAQARIDDVVVDHDARGRGIAEALSREALRIARDAGAKNVTLTSRPDREAANRLYRRIGFEPIETNVYRYPLT